MKKDMLNEPNRQIDYITARYDNSSNESQSLFSPSICDTRTFGLKKYYNHPDFQIVLDFGDSKIKYLIERFCWMVQDGRRFKSDDLVSGITTDCDLKLFEITEGDEKLLRIIVSDKCHRFPEDENCEFPYNLQYMSTEELNAKINL